MIPGQTSWADKLMLCHDVCDVLRISKRMLMVYFRKDCRFAFESKIRSFINQKMF